MTPMLSQLTPAPDMSLKLSQLIPAPAMSPTLAQLTDEIDSNSILVGTLMSPPESSELQITT